MMDDRSLVFRATAAAAFSGMASILLLISYDVGQGFSAEIFVLPAVIGFLLFQGIVGRFFGILYCFGAAWITLMLVIEGPF